MAFDKKVYMHEWRKNNPESVMGYNKKYRETHEKEIMVYSKKYYESHKENNKKSVREYRQSARGKLAKKKAAHNDYQRHKIARDRTKRIWYKTEKGKAQIMKDRAKRRAIDPTAFGAIIKAESILMSDIIKRDGGLCRLCSQPIKTDVYYLNSNYPTLDHIIPLSKGGNHTATNVQLAHRGCNSRKYNLEESPDGK